MSKIQAILELLRILQPYLKDIVPLVKAIIEAIRQFREDQPLVGASTADTDEIVAAAVAAGCEESEVRDVIEA